GAEVVGQQAGDPGGRESLALHHVAPVAGGVADRQEDRLPFVARPPRRLVPPWVPVDGVIEMLLEIRARLSEQVVRLRLRPGGPRSARPRGERGGEQGGPDDGRAHDPVLSHGLPILTHRPRRDPHAEAGASPRGVQGLLRPPIYLWPGAVFSGGNFDQEAILADDRDAGPARREQASLSGARHASRRPRGRRESSAG